MELLNNCEFGILIEAVGFEKVFKRFLLPIFDGGEDLVEGEPPALKKTDNTAPLAVVSSCVIKVWEAALQLVFQKFGRGKFFFCCADCLMDVFFVNSSAA